MRVMGSDLAILSAERYDDGRRVQRPASNGTAMKKAISSGGDKSVPKKRARKQPPVDQDEHDEEKKRARGRPRLDTTDQTPQEAGVPVLTPQQRRRTQIRLAQRAYRDRKESAITNLEREVESLKTTNDQMTQAYQDVFDYAASNGLLDAKSELGRKLMRLKALAKKSTDVYDDYNGSSPEDGTDETQLPDELRRQSDPSVNSSENVDSSGSSIKQAFPRPEPPQQLWAGVMVTHEPVNEAKALPPLPPPRGQHQLYPTLYDGGPSSHHPPGPIGYEIIAQPTSQNASFAPQLSFDPSTAYGGAGMHPSWTPSPWASLPNPSSLAYQERSFARRLHRTALQRAARLITMKNPPSEAVLRVFGFARLFETLEQIRERTLDLLTRTERESLFNQEYPFQQLGGMGTHFPAAHETSEHPSSSPTMLGGGLPTGRSGKEDHHPFIMGPMDPRVGKIRETLVSLGGEINLPGFDGQFWDPDEVQIYLMHNGVEIPPAVDHHTVELEDGAFGPPPSQVQDEDDLAQFAAARHADFSSTAAVPGAAGSGTGTATVSGLGGSVASVTSAVPASAPRLTSPVARPDAMPSAAPHTVDASPLWPHGHSTVGHQFSPTGSAAAASNMPVFPTHTFPSPNVMGFSVEMGGPAHYSSNHPTVGASGHHHHHLGASTTKRSWRINVDVFLHQLIIKMTCLGRSPGIRPKDVDLAFWASVTGPSPA
ncbi:hypothetical protein PG985_003420 [Apiospora marii]|uniref:uncharacterized protein n=1 Tax=Apiospora marii TaxID=335849 RepID=UPI00312ED65E